MSGQFPIGAEDTLKSVQSSDPGPNISCWEACPRLSLSANTNKLQENRTNEPLLKVSLGFVGI